MLRLSQSVLLGFNSVLTPCLRLKPVCNPRLKCALTIEGLKAKVSVKIWLVVWPPLFSLFSEKPRFESVTHCYKPQVGSNGISATKMACPEVLTGFAIKYSHWSQAHDLPSVRTWENTNRDVCSQNPGISISHLKIDLSAAIKRPCAHLISLHVVYTIRTGCRGSFEASEVRKTVWR